MRRATAGFALGLMLVASTQVVLAQEDRYPPQEGDEVVVNGSWPKDSMTR